MSLFNEQDPDYLHSFWLILLIIGSILITLGIFWWLDIGVMGNF